MNIRLATSNDEDPIWQIMQPIIAQGDAYVYEPTLSKQDALADWMGPDNTCYVVEGEGGIVGTYFLKPNKPGLGAHIANASFMVKQQAKGQKVGLAMGQHALAQAKQQGYHALQFNMVVSTNKAAIALWQKLGFSIIGTIPDGFNQAGTGFVDAHIMYKKL